MRGTWCVVIAAGAAVPASGQALYFYGLLDRDGVSDHGLIRAEIPGAPDAVSIGGPSSVLGQTSFQNISLGRGVGEEVFALSAFTVTGSEFDVFDASTGVATTRALPVPAEVSAAALGGLVFVNGITFRPETGEAFYIARAAGVTGLSSFVVRFDPEGGPAAAVPISGAVGPDAITSLATREDGALLAAVGTTGDIFAIDPGTGSSTLLTNARIGADLGSLGFVGSDILTSISRIGDETFVVFGTDSPASAAADTFLFDFDPFGGGVSFRARYDFDGILIGAVTNPTPGTAVTFAGAAVLGVGRRRR